MLRSYNPALLGPVWDGSKHIPRGFAVRVPAALVSMSESQVRAALPSGPSFARQVPDAYHKVRRGESLSVIAARYGTSIRELMALNGLSSQHRIRAGQDLRLPGASGEAAPVATATLAANAETYTVRKGDTLGVIAARAGISEADLLNRNGLRNKNHIKVGQVLSLRPATSVAQAAAAEASTTPAADAVVAAALTTAATPGESATAAASTGGTSAAAAKPAVATAPDVTPTAQLAMVPPVTATTSSPPAKAAVTETVGTVATADGDIDADAGADDVTEFAGITQARAEYAANASLADPNDYTVNVDGTIEIQASETLGHYAEWLSLTAQRLRQLNGYGKSTPLVVGNRIKLDFSHVSKPIFEAQRIAHHRDIQEAFFVNYRVTATSEHTLRAGESVWEIVQAQGNVPVWLLRQYNPDLDFSRVKPGMSIVVPKVQPVSRGADNRATRVHAG